MLIDTRTKESMIASFATYLDVTEDELFQYIEYAADKAQQDSWAFNTDIFEGELLSIFRIYSQKSKLMKYMYIICRED